MTKIHYETEKGLIERFITAILLPSSFLYKISVLIRNYLYKINLIKSVKFPVYTISIGNLTTGGTGKTPISIEIAKYIKNKLNKNVIILSRGYGGKLPLNQVNVISDGNKILYTADIAGDEPYLIARETKNIPVLTGKSRINSAKFAIEKFKPDVLILDDGFQHLKLKRDLDIVVIDKEKGFGNNHTLPSGPLREPLKSLKRADIFIISDKNTSKKEIKDFLPDNIIKPIFNCKFKAGKAYDILDPDKILNEQNVIAFTGIAQPDLFFNYIKESKLNLIKTMEFPDHYLYNLIDIRNIVYEASKNNANSIITTEKDAVKITSLLKNNNFNIPFYALTLDLELNIKDILKELQA